MTSIKWTSAVAVGHLEIDEQHKTLFQLAEAAAESLLTASDRKPNAERLRALVDFAREHFAFEEGLMRTAGYPEAERHAKYHVALLAELTTYCARLDQGRRTNLPGLVAFLWSWLLVHIDTADRDLADWIKAQGVDSGSVREEDRS